MLPICSALRIELLLNSYDLPPWDHPHLAAHLCQILSLSAFRIRPVGCSAGALMMQSVICHSHVGRHIGPPRSFHQHVIPRRSQAEANHLTVRHFFHWPGRNVHEADGKPPPAQPPSEARDSAMKRRGGGLGSCSYLGQYDASQRSDRYRNSQEHRIQSRRSRIPEID